MSRVKILSGDGVVLTAKTMAELKDAIGEGTLFSFPPKGHEVTYVVDKQPKSQRISPEHDNYRPIDKR